MRRLFPASIVALFLTLPVLAGEDGLTGHWKFSFFQGDNQNMLWLVRLDSKDGKLSASAEPLRDAPPAKVEEIKQIGDTIQIKFRATIADKNEKQTVPFDYEGKLPKPGAKKILGSVSLGGRTFPAVMEATAAKNSFEVEKEILQRTPSDPRAIGAILEVIETAKENKLDAKDLQELVDGSLKASELFGPRFHMSHNLRLLSALRAEKDFAAVTLETARKIVKQVDPKSPPSNQMQTLAAVAEVLRSSDKKDEATALDVRIDKLEGQAYTEYAKDALNFKTDKFAGRKGKSKRAVVVELFTGAMCPPCVAADMGFDGLEKAYTGKEVVLLQYHMHIPRPDPLASADGDARFEYYGDNYRKQVRGTPSILFNGKPEAPGGGAREDAPEKFKEYCTLVNKLLETPAEVELAASAVRTGDKIDITAKATGLDKPGAQMRLRLVLVEDWVRFKGSNALQYHHRVVRALPGGTKGFTLKAKDSEHTASIDLTELRRKLNKYLDEDYDKDGPRPMRLRDLHVVAFVQNDDTTEILQAIDVAVRDEK